MKAITIIQPWAEFIACGAKTIETRGWETKHRGPILIHAGKHFNRMEFDTWMMNRTYREVLQANRPDLYTAGHLCEYRLSFGKVIAVAELVECIPVEELEGSKSMELERDLGDYSPGRFGWLLWNVQRLAVPVAVRGSQGVFDVKFDEGKLPRGF